MKNVFQAAGVTFGFLCPIFSSFAASPSVIDAGGKFEADQYPVITEEFALSVVNECSSGQVQQTDVRLHHGMKFDHIVSSSLNGVLRQKMSVQTEILSADRNSFSIRVDGLVHPFQAKPEKFLLDGSQCIWPTTSPSLEATFSCAEVDFKEVPKLQSIFRYIQDSGLPEYEVTTGTYLLQEGKRVPATRVVKKQNLALFGAIESDSDEKAYQQMTKQPAQELFVSIFSPDVPLHSTSFCQQSELYRADVFQNLQGEELSAEVTETSPHKN